MRRETIETEKQAVNMLLNAVKSNISTQESVVIVSLLQPASSGR